MTRRHRRERGSDRRRRQDRWGMVLVGIAVVGVVAVLAVRMLLEPAPPTADGCPSRGPTALLAVVIDSTDSLTEAQRINVQNRLVAAVDSVEAATAVQVWRVAPTGSAVPQPVGEPLCRPDTRQSGWVSNPTLTAERYQEFRTKVLGQIAGAVDSKSESESPILETLQAVQLRYFDAESYRRVPVKRVVIVSDLVQNSRQLSLIGRAKTFSEFSATPEFRSVRVDMNGVAVDALQLNRAQIASPVGLITFWQQLLNSYGARLENVDPI